MIHFLKINYFYKSCRILLEWSSPKRYSVAQWNWIQGKENFFERGLINFLYEKHFFQKSNENRSHNKGEKFEKFPRKEFPRKEFNNKDRFHGNDNFRSSDKYRDRDEEYEKERSRSRSKENYERKPVHFNKNPKCLNILFVLKIFSFSSWGEKILCSALWKKRK